MRLPGSAHDTTVWSLAANQDPGNVRLPDLETLGDVSGAEDMSVVASSV